MKQVWKYTLIAEESNLIKMPLGSEILSVESQRIGGYLGSIVVYALVNPEQEEKQTIDFRTYGTGHNINIDTTDYKFLNTVKLEDDNLIFHVFYKRVD